MITISRTDFDDDRWFVGQTIRQALNEKWNVLAEVFAAPRTRTQAGALTFSLAAARNGSSAKIFLLARFWARPPVTTVPT